MHFDGERYEEWTIPARERQEFETDLASIPSLAGWLVPKDGRHTPAALVHDAMIVDPGDKHRYQGRAVNAEEADAIFRQAMQFLGVKFWRRWMIWSAVCLLTFWRSADDTSLLRFLNRLRMMFGLAFAVAGLFLFPAVLDFPSLASYGPDAIPGLRNLARLVKLLWRLPEGPLLEEFARFAAVVVVGTVLYAALWGRRWRFGLVVGVTLPLISWPMAVGAVSTHPSWGAPSTVDPSPERALGP